MAKLLARQVNGHDFRIAISGGSGVAVAWCTTCDPDARDSITVTHDQFPDPDQAYEMITDFVQIHSMEAL